MPVGARPGKAGQVERSGAGKGTGAEFEALERCHCR